MKIPSTTTLQYGTGYFVFVSCRLIRDMIFAHLLGPEAFGVWAGLSIYRQYAGYSDLGLTNGLRRRLPQLLETQKERDASTTAGLAWNGSMASTSLFAVLILLAAYCWQAEPTLQFWGGMATLLVMMFLDKHYMYLSVLFQSTRRVGEAGIWMGVLGTVELLLGIALVSQFGLVGLFVSLCLSSILICSAMMLRRPFQARLRFERRLLRSLGVASLTLMGFGLVNVAIHSVDRVAILWQLGEGADISQYHIAAVLGLMVSQIPSVLLAVWVPEIYRFGNQDRSKLRQFLLSPTALVATCSALVAAMLWLTVPAVVDRFLPQYRPALLIFGWLLIAEMFFSMTSVAQTIEIALERSHRSLLIRVASVLCGFVGSLWLLSSGSGLPAIAMLICAVHGVAWLIVGSMAARALRVSLGRYLIASLGPPLFAGGILAGISWLQGDVNPTELDRLSAILIFLVVFSPCLLLVLSLRDGKSTWSSHRTAIFAKIGRLKYKLWVCLFSPQYLPRRDSEAHQQIIEETERDLYGDRTIQQFEAAEPSEQRRLAKRTLAQFLCQRKIIGSRSINAARQCLYGAALLPLACHLLMRSWRDARRVPAGAGKSDTVVFFLADRLRNCLGPDSFASEPYLLKRAGVHFGLTEIGFLSRTVWTNPRFLLYPELLANCLRWTCHYGYVVRYFAPQTVVHFFETTASSSLMTSFLHQFQIQHVNIQHGERWPTADAAFCAFDEIRVWGEHFRAIFYGQKSFAQRIVPQGNPGHQRVFSEIRNRFQPRPQRLLIIDPYVYEQTAYDYAGLVRTIEQLDGDWEVCVRRHPTDDREQLDCLAQLRREPSLRQRPIQFVEELPRDVPIEESLVKSRVVVGIASAALIDAWVAGCKVIYLASSLDRDLLLDRFGDSPNVIYSSDLVDLRQFLNNSATLSTAEDQRVNYLTRVLPGNKIESPSTAGHSARKVA